MIGFIEALAYIAFGYLIARKGRKILIQLKKFTTENIQIVFTKDKKSGVLQLRWGKDLHADVKQPPLLPPVQ